MFGNCLVGSHYVLTGIIFYIFYKSDSVELLETSLAFSSPVPSSTVAPAPLPELSCSPLLFLRSFIVMPVSSFSSASSSTMLICLFFFRLSFCAVLAASSCWLLSELAELELELASKLFTIPHLLISSEMLISGLSYVGILITLPLAVVPISEYLPPPFGSPASGSPLPAAAAFSDSFSSTLSF